MWSRSAPCAIAAEDERALEEALRSGGAPRLFVIEAEYALHMTRAELAWVETTAEEITAGTLAWPGTTDEVEGDPS